MKILQINAKVGTGSVGRIVTGIYDQLIENGHECKIAYGRGQATGVSERDTIRIGSENEVKMHALLSRITGRTGFYFAKSTGKLINEIEKYNPDIIHMHGNYGYYINIEVLLRYLAKAKIPIVNTLHSCWDFTGHCCHFDYIDCNRWKTGCYNCPQKKAYPKSYIFDTSRKNYQEKKDLFMAIENMMIVTPSHWLEGLVQQSFLSQYPVKVIYNGIDLNTFKPTPSSFRKKYHCEDKIVVLGVANVWGKRKGFDAFMQLEKALPNNYKIVLVGLNDKQKKVIPENIIGITQTNNTRELAEIYTASDVFVNPTLEDNFPTTNLEALACGTPVITYDTGGSPESLDNNCGKVVEKNNIEEIINILVKKKYKTSKEDCIKRSTHFNKTIRFNEYIELYKKMVINNE